MRLKIDTDTKAAMKVVQDVQKAVPAASVSALTRAGQGIKTGEPQGSGIVYCQGKRRECSHEDHQR
ncbi:hypothetical protein P7H22_26235 [Paenibacillus larvae]|nr:hypothetical protein [Paenibacillus larvae]MDT2243129.1 hypothetical protein [Paenibacillus larvae]